MVRTTPIDRSNEHKPWHRFDRGMCLYCGWYCYDCPIGVATCKCILINEENIVFSEDALKADVIKLLVNEYDLTFDEAEEAVNESAETKPDMWNENASAADLAKFLASDDDDD